MQIWHLQSDVSRERAYANFGLYPGDSRNQYNLVSESSISKS